MCFKLFAQTTFRVNGPVYVKEVNGVGITRRYFVIIVIIIRT